MKTVDLTGKLEPESVPMCPLCDQPIDYTLYTIGFVRHEWGESYCLICMDCAEEVEGE